jgi:hypothetical protein
MGVDAAVGIEGHQGKFPDGFYFQILSVGLNNLQKVCGRSIGIHKNMVQNSHPSKADFHQKDDGDMNSIYKSCHINNVNDTIYINDMSDMSDMNNVNDMNDMDKI